MPPTAALSSKHKSVRMFDKAGPVGPLGKHLYIIYPIPGGVAGFGSPESLKSPLCIMETESFFHR